MVWVPPPPKVQMKAGPSTQSKECERRKEASCRPPHYSTQISPNDTHDGHTQDAHRGSQREN